MQAFAQQAPQGQVQVVEKIVYVDRPQIVEKIVERIVEKPVYIDRPIHVPVPQMQSSQSMPMTMQGNMFPQQGMQGMQGMEMQGMEVVNPVQQGAARGQNAPILEAQDHHHIIERPVYIYAERPGGDEGSAAVIRDVQIIERPVYIPTPVPIPFERPVPVPVPQTLLERQKGRTVFERQYGLGNDQFPYHNPYPHIGCDFHDNRLEASNEPDPVKSFLENFKLFS